MERGWKVKETRRVDKLKGIGHAGSVKSYRSNRNEDKEKQGETGTKKRRTWRNKEGEGGAKRRKS